MSGRHWWDLDELRRVRGAHMRKAKLAGKLARETDGATRSTWREHCRQHVKAARRQNWLIVGQSRRVSACFFLRKTVGYDLRARGH